MADRADEYYAHAMDLLATFSTKHGEIDANRNLVRQRTIPDEEVKGKRLITVRQAHAFALVSQLRAFFSRAATKIKVRPENNSKKEIGYTTEQEKWLTGFSHAISSRAGFVYSDAMWHGLESGEMILQSVFNPLFARQGVLGLRPKAIDPRSAAYEWTEDGLGCFVLDETERAGVAYKEFNGVYQRAGQKVAKGFSLPKEFVDKAERTPTATVKLTKYYDAVNEYLWIDTTHVWTRPHEMGQVPFHVGYFYDMPADWSHPEERGRGVISPIRDLLQEKETLYDIWATNAEFSQRPMVLWFDQAANVWKIGVGNPGSKFDGPMGTPPREWKGSADYQLLEKLSAELNLQIEINTLPQSQLAGEQGNASGFALSLYNEPVKARFDALRPYAELCLGSHYELILKAYKKFARPQLARALAGGYTQEYLDSFAVSVDIEVKGGGGQKKAHSWQTIKPEDISEHPVVEVSLNPSLPTDKGAQMQQYQLAMQSETIPRKWAWDNILEADDPDAMEREYKFEWLLKNDSVTQGLVMDLWREDWLDENPDIRKRAEQLAAEAEQEAMDQPAQEAPPMSPMDFAQQQGLGGDMGQGMAPDQMAQQQQGAPPLPVGPGLPSAATLQPQGAMSPMDFLPPQGMGA